MLRRQIVPKHWFVATGPAEDTLHIAATLPRGSGLLLLQSISTPQRRRLRLIARHRRLTIAEEGTGAARRVHGIGELRLALLQATPLILLSPLFETTTHPDWQPLPRMRAAALARLANRRLIALGGMNDRRFAGLAPLGFIGWAGISAFRT